MLFMFIHLKDKTNLFKNSINIISLFWILIHLYVSLKLAFSIDQLIILHVGIASIIIFANHYLEKKNPKYLKMIFLLGIIMSIIVTFTFLFSYNSIVQREIGRAPCRERV